MGISRKTPRGACNRFQKERWENFDISTCEIRTIGIDV